jgi:flagellar hook-length control protein FliK
MKEIATNIPLLDNRAEPVIRPNSTSSGDQKKVDLESVSFKKVYAQVARENRQAQSTPDDSESSSADAPISMDGASDNQPGMSTVEQVQYVLNLIQSSDKDISGNELEIDIESILQSIAGALPEPEIPLVPATQPEQGSAIIIEALSEVSRIFDLNLVGPLDELSVENPDQFIIKQFAEILSTLKSIAVVLEDAGQENVALDVQEGTVLEPQQAVQIHKTLVTDIFRIELGLKMIGVGAEVAEQVVVPEQKQSDYSGIPKALNPAEITMPESQIKQVFTTLLETSQTQIESAIARISLLAQKAVKGQEKPAIQNTEIIIAKKPTSTSELETFESSIMRKLLKIEAPAQKTESTVTNQVAGDSKELPASPAVTKSLKSLSEIIPKLAETMAPIGERSQPNPIVLESSPKQSLVASRTVEQSVLNQVTERLQTAFRSGSAQHEIRIQLRPESLGEVNLKIQINGDMVTAKIQVESQQVKQIIENNMQSLRNALQEHNLQSGSLDVSVDRRFEERQNDRGENMVDRQNVHDDIAPVDVDSGVLTGTDTGKRYGENSIEYFA